MFINWKKGARLAVLALFAACSTDPNATAPTAPTLQSPTAAQSLQVGPLPIGTLTSMRPLTRRAPLRNDLTASANIGPAGGTLRLPEAGFTLTVPAGAVSGPTPFSVTALAGTDVAYEFEPHGTVFLRPLSASQELRGTRSALIQSALMAGYFANRSALSASGVGTMVSERIAGALDPRHNAFKWPIHHFSGYIVAW